jgi:hypothetical protein
MLQSKLVIIPNESVDSGLGRYHRGRAMIESMRICVAVVALLALSEVGTAQNPPAPQTQPKVVTVPATIDHNRILIEAEVLLPGGAGERIHAWIDNGNPDLEMSRRLAGSMGLNVACDDKACSAPAPHELLIGGMSIPLDAVKSALIPLKPVSAASALAAGLNAEINLPSAVLRNYDVLIDFPGRKFTIGRPGTIHFQGQSVKVQLASTTGLIQVPSQIENKKYNLELDLGSNISFLSAELFDKVAITHPDWPHMTGAVGSANMWGLDDEPKWKLTRLDRVQYGPLFLTNEAVVEFPKERMEFFEMRAGIPTVGLLGSQALLNYRVGIDYAHSTVYFDIGRMFNFPDFDVVGLVLRPEDNGQFSILGVADFDGKPSIATGPDGVQPGDHLIAVDDISVRGSTMGQVWAMLGGTPGQERKLTIERAGKEFAVAATIMHFLGETPDENVRKPRK